mmetsp:Transcript_13438/g.56418  ORF Transcript_13438/g.56418 Transcript_13438/m.56418 type:complete len:499 (+) Transcript_13438:2467-3963(+)
MAMPASPIARASSHSLSPKSATTAAASPKYPKAHAPTTERLMSVLMSTTRLRSDPTAFTAMGGRPTTTATSATYLSPRASSLTAEKSERNRHTHATCVGHGGSEPFGNVFSRQLAILARSVFFSYGATFATSTTVSAFCRASDRARLAWSLASFSASTSCDGVAVLEACSTSTVFVGTITFTERTPGRLSRMLWISGTSLGQQMPSTFRRVCVDASSPPACSAATKSATAFWLIGLSSDDTGSPDGCRAPETARGMYLPPPNPDSPPAVALALAPFAASPSRKRTTSSPPWSTTVALLPCPGPPAQLAPQSETASSTMCSRRPFTTKSRWSPWRTPSACARIRNARASSGSAGKPSAVTCASVNATPRSFAARDVSTGTTAGTQPPSGARTTSWPSMRNASRPPGPAEAEAESDLAPEGAIRNTVGSRQMPCSSHGDAVPHAEHASFPLFNRSPPPGGDDIAPRDAQCGWGGQTRAEGLAKITKADVGKPHLFRLWDF